MMIGAGTAWAARELLSPFGEVLRPLAKAGLKSGLQAAERGREAVARLAEMVDDLMAEVQAERALDELSAAGAEWESPHEAKEG
jgi:hypothetical protein